MGETVTKVLVDGEEFGDDPGMAVKKFTCRCHQGSTSFKNAQRHRRTTFVTVVGDES
jgi:hypothetical protein